MSVQRRMEIKAVERETTSERTKRSLSLSLTLFHSLSLTGSDNIERSAVRCH